MNARVIDTNVILVANEMHPDVSPECVMECVGRLNELRNSGVLVLDDMYLILSEYQNKTTPRKGKGVGDVFVKWALSMLGRPDKVHLVKITDNGLEQYAEFPAPDLEADFDPPDRKFAAVSNAHPNRAPIWQAADCKWIDWWPALHAKGVRVEFLCGDDVCRFYSKKFPQKPDPQLP